MKRLKKKLSDLNRDGKSAERAGFCCLKACLTEGKCSGTFVNQEYDLIYKAFHILKMRMGRAEPRGWERHVAAQVGERLCFRLSEQEYKGFLRW